MSIAIPPRHIYVEGPDGTLIQQENPAWAAYFFPNGPGQQGSGGGLGAPAGTGGVATPTLDLPSYQPVFSPEDFATPAEYEAAIAGLVPDFFNDPITGQVDPTRAAFMDQRGRPAGMFNEGMNGIAFENWVRNNPDAALNLYFAVRPSGEAWLTPGEQATVARVVGPQRLEEFRNEARQEAGLGFQAEGGPVTPGQAAALAPGELPPGAQFSGPAETTRDPRVPVDRSGAVPTPLEENPDRSGARPVPVQQLPDRSGARPTPMIVPPPPPPAVGPPPAQPPPPQQAAPPPPPPPAQAPAYPSQPLPGEQGFTEFGPGELPTGQPRPTPAPPPPSIAGGGGGFTTQSAAFSYGGPAQGNFEPPLPGMVWDGQMGQWVFPRPSMPPPAPPNFPNR